MRQAPTDIGDACRCAEGYYNTTRSLIKCYEVGQRYIDRSSLPSVTDICMPCDDNECITCFGGLPRIRAGYSVSQRMLDQDQDFVDAGKSTGQRAVYACPLQDTCTGNLSKPCQEGSDGPLCSGCAAGWSHPGLTGECKKCDNDIGTIWVGIGTVFVGCMATATLYFVSGVDSNAGFMHTIITFGKIAISLVQILSQVDIALQLQWPAIFRRFLDLLRIFSFDFLGFLDIGCVTSYSYFGKCAFAFFMMPGLLAITFIVYLVRRDMVGIEDRCVKMALTGVFLSYPLISQTFFQGFSCSVRDENESWLDVDNQISCLGADYALFFPIGLLAIALIPVGIPLATLLVLMRNAGEDGKFTEADAAFKRYGESILVPHFSSICLSLPFVLPFHCLCLKMDRRGRILGC
eukprot:SAG22_NODE_482_length_9931_cov_9.247254_6_plen_405_part_00